MTASQSKGFVGVGLTVVGLLGLIGAIVALLHLLVADVLSDAADIDLAGVPSTWYVLVVVAAVVALSLLSGGVYVLITRHD